MVVLVIFTCNSEKLKNEGRQLADIEQFLIPDWKVELEGGIIQNLTGLLKSKIPNSI